MKHRSCLRNTSKRQSVKNLFLVAILSGVCVTTGNRLDRLDTSLKRDIFQVWSLASNFTDFSRLKTTHDSILRSIENDGDSTRSAIQRMMKKALKGENITMLVMGGSSTKGADLGSNNRVSTFHYALLHWWHAVITPYTGSRIKRENIAIGGVGSTYFGHCWKEYLDREEDIDLVLWEFNLNDPDSDDYGKGLEKFVRSVLAYPSKPALIFTKFFLRTEFPYCKDWKIVCPLDTYKFNIIHNLSVHYSFSVIDLLAPTCHYITTSNSPMLLVDSMFNHLHPSHLAHAQLGYMLISYMQNVISEFLDYVRMMKKRCQTRDRGHHEDMKVGDFSIGKDSLKGSSRPLHTYMSRSKEKHQGKQNDIPEQQVNHRKQQQQQQKQQKQQQQQQQKQQEQQQQQQQKQQKQQQQQQQKQQKQQQQQQQKQQKQQQHQKQHRQQMQHQKQHQKQKQKQIHQRQHQPHRDQRILHRKKYHETQRQHNQQRHHQRSCHQQQELSLINDSQPSKQTHKSLFQSFLTQLNTIGHQLRFQTHGKCEESDIIKRTIKSETRLRHTLYNASDVASCCWSAVLPDFRFRLPHHLFKLNMSHYYGMQIINKPIWDTQFGDRNDVRGGFRFHIGRNVTASFEIQPHTDAPPGERHGLYVAITHVIWGGITVFTVTNSFLEYGALTINCSREVHPAMHVYELGKFSPGRTYLSIATLTGGCQLSSVIVE